MTAGPTFEFSAFLVELDAMSHLVQDGGFLDGPSCARLADFRERVERLMHVKTSGTTARWEISRDRPLRTRHCPGAYRPQATHGLASVVGELSVRWDVRLTGQRKKRSFAMFQVDNERGNASTRVSIKRATENGDVEEELAVWRSDIRSPGGVGCFYHTQVLGETNVTPFPDFLGVPRFPDPFVTPMAVLEFLLSELFPEAWDEHLSSSAHSTDTWRQSQKQRWMDLLDAQRQIVGHPRASPWLALRSWSPSEPRSC